MSKRFNGEGTTRAKGNGFEWRYSYRDSETGELSRGSVYAKTQDALKIRQAEIKKRIENEQPVVDSVQTVGAWCEEWCTQSLRVSSRKESTKENYERLLRKHVQPEPFGAITLRKLRPLDIERLMFSLTEKGLAASTRRSIFNVLNTMLETARRDNLLAANPIQRGELHRPKLERVEQRFLDNKEVEEVLCKVNGEHNESILRLIAGTGLRKGEALALDWWHVDFKKKILRVRWTLSRLNGGLTRTTPKSHNSVRDIDLAPEVIALLQKQKKHQQAQKDAAGDQWKEHENAFVFTTPLGSPIEPRNLLRSVEGATKRSGIEPTGIGVHTFRHSAATNMLLAGEPIHVVSRILGHDDIQTTVNVYGHVTAASKRSALEGLSRRLSS
jgi:integrase